MALYVLICHDVPNSGELRNAHRPTHLERLKKLESEGKLKLAGFTPQSHNVDGNLVTTGSVMMIDFDSEQAVQDWVSQEPFLLGGVYSHVDIKPFVQTLPALS